MHFVLNNMTSRFRRGASSVELLVAFGLLTTLLSMSVPLMVRHQRLLTSARHYRLAVEELANQLERLSALPPEELDAAVEQLRVSDFTAAKLRGAELTGAIDAAEFGRRVALQIVWDEPRRRSAPVTMAAWVQRPISPVVDAPSQEDQP